MKGLLFLSALLFIPGHTGTDTPREYQAEVATHSASESTTNVSKPTSSELQSTTTVNTSTIRTTTRTTTTTTRTPTTTSTNPTPPTSIIEFYKQECRLLFMGSGILIIICIVFLIFILMLLYKVCQLSRRLKMLSNSDLINMSESWMGTAESNKNKPETEAKESTMLMADLSQTQDETNNGTIKEAGEKVKEDEQTREEKEAGDTANSEEASAAPATAAESSSSSKPEEEATDSQRDKAVEAASSEGKEEPDVEKK